MFKFFKNLLTKPIMAPPDDAGPTVFHVQKMTLDERKAWRREMVYKSVRETFESLEVIGSMYKFKITPVDSRGHSYIMMIDITSSFAVGRRIPIEGFADIERLIVKNTYERYGINVAGIYWRTDSNKTIFERPEVKIQNLANAFSDTVPNVENDAPVKRTRASDYSPIADDEREAFMSALREGVKPPPVRIGMKEYQTDLAPLEGMDGYPPTQPFKTEFGDLGNVI